jgi:hypothetical protein
MGHFQSCTYIQASTLYCICAMPAFGVLLAIGWTSTISALPDLVSAPGHNSRSVECLQIVLRKSSSDFSCEI